MDTFNYPPGADTPDAPWNRTFPPGVEEALGKCCAADDPQFHKGARVFSWMLGYGTLLSEHDEVGWAFVRWDDGKEEMFNVSELEEALQLSEDDYEDDGEGFTSILAEDALGNEQRVGVGNMRLLP